MKVVKSRSLDDLTINYILVDKNYDIVIPVNKYLNYLNATGKSPNTSKNYCYHLKIYFEFLEIMNIEYNKIKTEILIDFIQWLRKPIRSTKINFIHNEHSVCNKTINTIITAIASFYQYICRIEDIVNPIISSRSSIYNYKGFLIHAGKKDISKNLLNCRTKKRIIKTISNDKFNDFLKNIKNLRDKLIILLMYEGGLRIGEVLGLWIEDLFILNRQIRIFPRDNLENGARSKSRIERFVDISSQLSKLMDDYLLFIRPDCRDSNHLFVIEKGRNTGKPVMYNTIYKMFKYYSKITKIDLHPHLLRHSHATSLIQAGWDAAYVQKRLGHEQVQTTINSYVHLGDNDMKQNYQKYLLWKEELNESN